jgi:hypothetical protein
MGIAHRAMSAERDAQDEEVADVEAVEDDLDTSSQAVPVHVTADDDGDDEEDEEDEQPSSPIASEAASEVVVVASDDEEEEALATVLVEESGDPTDKSAIARKKPGPKPKRKRTSTDRQDAANEARAMLRDCVTRLPWSETEANVIRSMGRVVTDDERFYNQHHIYPIGFSCDRFEFSPVHGRIIKLRCTILDGSKVRAKQEELGTPVTAKDGPLFRIMWGAGIDEQGETSVDYPYNMDNASPVVTEGRSSPPSVELLPEVGMRVRVKYGPDQWYMGTIMDVEEHSKDEAEITIQYDDGTIEHAIHPDSGITLFLPGTLIVFSLCVAMSKLI